MKKAYFILLLVSSFSFAQQPELFLPELFSGLPNVRDFSMNKNQDEFYFTVESYLKEYSFIAYSKKVNGKWGKTEVVSFSGKYKDLEPFLSPDGLKLFFASNRKNNTSDEIKKDMDIWYVTRNSLSSDCASFNSSSVNDVISVINAILSNLLRQSLIALFFDLIC